MKRLKWLLVTAALMGASATPANAQAALLVLLFGDKVASENFFFSLKFGANLGDVTGIDNTEMKLGWNFGLLGTIKLSDRLSLVPEFAPLSQKGAKNIPYVPSGDAALDNLIAPPDDARLNFNYIDIPVIAKYQIADRIAIGTGPQFGYLTSASFDYDRSLNDDDHLTYSQASQVTWNKFDAGWAFELMFSLGDARGGKGINVHARYTLGLLDTVKDNPGNAVKNSVFQFFVSFPFIELADDNGS